MASAEIDRKVLAHWATEARKFNMLLSEGICTVIAISHQLTDRLARAHQQRTIDIARETRSLDLYQQIIFLAREGLAHTEVYILPHCGHNAHGELQVMAVKMQATFNHIFCLYHNTPTVRQLQLRQRSMDDPNSLGAKYMAARQDWAGLSGSPAPSVQSYITNPYAAQGQSPPVQAPVSVHAPPKISFQPRTTPARPPGLGMDTIFDYDPPVSASAFLMPILDYTPNTKHFFERASRRAKAFMPASHVISLSVAHARSEFLFECLGDHHGAMDVIKDAIRAACKEDPSIMRPVEVVDGEKYYPLTDQFNLIQDMSILAQQIEKVSDIEPVLRRQQVASPPLYPPPDRELPSPPCQGNSSAVANASHHRNGSANIKLSPPGGVSLGTPYRKAQDVSSSPSPAAVNPPTGSKSLNDAASRNDTLVGSPPPVMNLDSQILLINNQIQKEAAEDFEAFTYDEVTEARANSQAGHSHGNVFKSNGGGRMEGTVTVKERKRRALEKAEDRLARQRKAAITKATMEEKDGYYFV